MGPPHGESHDDVRLSSPSHTGAPAREHRLASVLDAVPTPTFELDGAGRVRRWNRAAAHLLGWRAAEVEELPLTGMGDGWAALGPGIAQARRGVASTGQLDVVHRDGRRLALEVRLNPLIDDRGAASIIGTLTDHTERLAMETAIRRSQRMEALGQFAGGIAHDFGNIVSAIAGFADLLELELPEDAGARADVARIREVAERGRRMTERLLDFAHSRPSEPSVVDVAAAVRGLEDLLEAGLPDGCDLHLDLDDHAPPVLLGSGQLDQVLLNLVSNAGDAMPDGGRITVRVAGVDGGAAVAIEVTDQGTGIPAPVLDHVFEPFFTTKGGQGGTGLGLANVYAIVRGAGGHIEARSRPGRGSTFAILLPACAPDAAPSEPAPTAPRLLVVEPEKVSRQVLRTALVGAGHRVLAVPDAGAVDLADVTRTDPVAVVVCPATAGAPADPGLAELLHRIRRLRPEVPLVELGERDAASSDPGVTTIPRPYVVDEVRRAVRRALLRADVDGA